jgi:hypothetical protein
MFSPTVRKLICLNALSKISCFYDLGEPGTFSLPNRILRDTGTELFKTHKTGLVPEKLGVPTHTKADGSTLTPSWVRLSTTDGRNLGDACRDTDGPLQQTLVLVYTAATRWQNIRNNTRHLWDANETTLTSCSASTASCRSHDFYHQRANSFFVNQLQLAKQHTQR